MAIDLDDHGARNIEWPLPEGKILRILRDHSVKLKDADEVVVTKNGQPQVLHYVEAASDEWRIGLRA